MKALIISFLVWRRCSTYGFGIQSPSGCRPIYAIKETIPTGRIFLDIGFGQDTSSKNHSQALTPSPPLKIPLSIPQAPQDLNIFDNATNISENCLKLRVGGPANTSADAKITRHGLEI
ncbi:uncharacterized protein Z518_04738 [Rhinocladiella mackenziei CBS 650.93]|uniref:Carboxylesterase type B domain-containing protein n=1 Tax=Rhinocladiella mackenziei CBS 650.93 TaxID=1442369 RepID=A0A0D2FWU6_9EURO|nr:uncharacterized protein Z518_04738 [Rhinocladiella mackenziei CBS 650.93]KIX06762.1 hypothetical protein Z518_04738 [Rhinocladiella mackenziei CBS 650.93]